MPGSANQIRAGEAYVELGTRLGSAFQQGLRGAEQRLKAWSTRLITAGALMIAPFAGGVKAAAGFELAMAKVSTMLDAQAMKHLPMLEAGVSNLSMKYGEATGTLAQGLYDILSASVPAEKALGVLDVSAKAAMAGITDTGIAADAVTTILNAFGIEAERAGDVADWFFSVVQRGKTDFPKLAAAIGRVASTAALAGVELTDLGALISTMTRAGIKTEETMTAVNAVIMGFLKPMQMAKKAAAEFGLDLSTATLKAEGLIGALGRLRSLTPEQIAEAFPNLRAIKGAAAAIKNYAALLFDKEQITNRAGATDAAAAKIMATLHQRAKTLWATLKSMATAVGQALVPAVGDLVDWLKSALGPMRQWLKDHGEWVRYAALTATGVIALGVALKGLLIPLKMLGVLFSRGGVFITAAFSILYLLDALGVVNTGFSEFLRSFRVGGLKLGTWFTSIGISIMKTWHVTINWLKVAWAKFVNWWKTLSLPLQEFFYRTIAKALGAADKDIEGHLKAFRARLERELAAELAANDAALNKTIKELDDALQGVVDADLADAAKGAKKLGEELQAAGNAGNFDAMVANFKDAENAAKNIRGELQQAGTFTGAAVPWKFGGGGQDKAIADLVKKLPAELKGPATRMQALLKQGNVDAKQRESLLREIKRLIGKALTKPVGVT